MVRKYWWDRSQAYTGFAVALEHPSPHSLPWTSLPPPTPTPGFGVQSMNKQAAIQVFDDKQVRTVWDADQEKWYFSIIDVIAALTDSPRVRKYWNALKTKLKE